MKNPKKQCDDLWSKLIKLKAGNQCEFCKKDSGLNSHHIFSRAKSSTRHDPDNGISLCAGHHCLSSQFSAHLTPVEFVEWIKAKRGEAWYKRLRLRADSVFKPDYKLIKLALETEIKKYEH